MPFQKQSLHDKMPEFKADISRCRVKICGITSPETAVQCFTAGADMIGMIHYPPSPRHIGIGQIRDILDAVVPFRKQGRKTVLVVVDGLPAAELFKKADDRLDFVQLHGSPAQTAKLEKQISIPVIRAVRDRGTFDQLLAQPEHAGSLQSASDLYLLEMSHGLLPGGNGAAWDWSAAKPFCERYPAFLAGGITPENVLRAVVAASPFGVDVSSGVEVSPGVKDLVKVQKLITKVKREGDERSDGTDICSETHGRDGIHQASSKS
ncbi:MAG: phosphoribosylanthranilate isomerase [Planctomycetaceae bacterium]|jgi:phosphoribosylanthranilate isomerase|nr:phosphoribosylanthranilate isomerase [Planctomycetaceae bacterium]